jgi:hypothetical protein
MWFRRKKPAYKEGELSVLGTVLSIISEHINDRIEIYGYTDYFTNLLDASGIEYEIQEYSFSWMKPCLIINHNGKNRVTISYWDADNFGIAKQSEKAKTSMLEVDEYEIKNEIERIKKGKYTPRVVIDGHLTKDQYIGALYARLDAVRHIIG